MRRHLSPTLLNGTRSSVRARVATQHRPRIGLLIKLLLAALALLMSLALAGTVGAQGEGVLTGQVLNGTSGAPQVGAGLPVTLHVLRGEAQDATLESTTDENGQFRFEGLDTDPGLEYWPEALYLDIPYSVAAPLSFSDQSAALSAEVTVYETTDDDSGLTLDSVHMIAESFGEALRISEIHLYGNSGDRTIVGSTGSQPQGATLFIPIPPEAVGLAFTEGAAPERYLEVDGGLVDTEPVAPGPESSLTFFSYHLMVTGSAIPLERVFAYPVTNLNILVAQPGLSLASEQLISMGSELFQDRQYELFMIQGLDADQKVAMELMPVDMVSGSAPGEMPSTVAGDGTSSVARGSQGVLLWIGVGLTVLAVLSAAIFPQVTRGRRKSRGQWKLASEPTVKPLIAELAALQQALEQGELDQADYQEQRARIYEEIRSL